MTNNTNQTWEKPSRHSDAAIDDLDGYTANPYDDCYIEMTITLVSREDDDGRNWYNWVESDDSGSYECGEWTLDEADARASAADYARANDASTAKTNHEQEQEDLQAAIDSLTDSVGHYDVIDSEYRVIATAATMQDAEALAAALSQQSDNETYTATDNLSAAEESMTDLERAEGDYGVLDMDGNIMVQCNDREDAGAWIEAESTARAIRLRGRSGHEGNYYPRSVVDLTRPYARNGQYSTGWSNS